MLLHKTVIIEKEEIEQKGIIDPNVVSQVGIVKEIGKGVIDDGNDITVIEIGDRVVYYTNAVMEIEFDGKKELVIDFDDIIKII